MTAKRLQEALDGQNLKLEDIALPQEADPSEPVTERLRRYMRLLQDARTRLGTDAYGRCGACGVDLAERELVALPWADRCRACASKRSA